MKNKLAVIALLCASLSASAQQTCIAGQRDGGEACQAVRKSPPIPFWIFLLSYFA